MGIEDELNAMNAVFGQGPGTQAPGTQAPGTSAPVTSAPSTSAPATQAPGTSAPSTSAPATQAPTTEVPDERDKEIAELRAKLAEREAKGPKTSALTTEAPLTLTDQDFVGDLDIDDLTESKDKLNKLLNTVFVKGVTEALKIVGDKMPTQVSTLVDTGLRMQKLNEEFYTTNKDLGGFKKVVAVVFGELRDKEPNKPIGDLLKDTAVETRKRLGLPLKAKNDPPPRKSNTPKLPAKKGGKTGGPPNKPSTGISSEIDEMNKVIGR